MTMPPLRVGCRRIATIAAAVSAVASAGCGPARRYAAQTTPATAVVTFEGRPVEGATVILSPLRGSRHASQGLTDPNGRAVLTTFVSGDGAVPGSYRVAVSWEEDLPNPELSIPDPTVDLEGYRKATEAAINAGKPIRIRRQLLPKKFSGFTSSGLEAKVQAGSDNVLRFDLGSADPPHATPGT